MACRALTLYAALFFTPMAWAKKAHVHGKAQLHVAVEGSKVTLMLEVPGDSVVGFEYSPKTPEDTEKVQNALNSLGKAENLFTLRDALGCQWERGEAKVSYHTHDHKEDHAKDSMKSANSHISAKNAHTHDHKHNHSHDHKKGSSSHGKDAKSAHKGGSGTHDHAKGSHSGGTHSEFSVTHIANCKTTPLKTDIKVNVIKVFPKVQTLEVTLILPDAQRQQILTTPDASLPL